MSTRDHLWSIHGVRSENGIQPGSLCKAGADSLSRVNLLCQVQPKTLQTDGSIRLDLTQKLDPTQQARSSLQI